MRGAWGMLFRALPGTAAGLLDSIMHGHPYHTMQGHHPEVLHRQLRRTENERNRRRDLVTALRGRREQMLLSLKRDHPRADRRALLGSGGGLDDRASGSGRETIKTAELDAPGLLSLQEEIMNQQDRDLESLEQSVAGTKVGCVRWFGHGAEMGVA